VPVGLLPLIAKDLHVPVSQAGLLVTGYGTVVAIVSVPLIRLTMAVSRRRLLTGVMVVFTVMTGVTAAAPGYWVLLGARVLTALAQAVFWPVAAVAAAGLMPPERRGRAAAYVFAGGSLAVVAGVPAGAWLGRAAGWRMTFVALAVLCAVTLAAVAVLLPEGPPGHGHETVGTEPDARQFTLLVVGLALVVMGTFTAYTYISEFLTKVSGFSSGQISPLLLANGVADITGLTLAGILVVRGARRLLIAAIGLMTAALADMWVLGEVRPAAATGFALMGAALAAIAVSMQARVMETAPGNTDLASAWGSAAFNVGIGGGALVGAILLPTAGVRSTALAGAILTAAALTLVAGARRRTPRAGARERGSRPHHRWARPGLLSGRRPS
jgi:predicted MFS family arabinose efflux permease